MRKFGISVYREQTWNWKAFLDKLKYPNSNGVTISLIGKYVELQDAYKSITGKFIHAGAMNEVKVQVVNMHCEFITKENVAENWMASMKALVCGPRVWCSLNIEGKFLL